VIVIRTDTHPREGEGKNKESANIVIYIVQPIRERWFGGRKGE
jgi:hypothetical protein